MAGETLAQEAERLLREAYDDARQHSPWYRPPIVDVTIMAHAIGAELNALRGVLADLESQGRVARLAGSDAYLVTRAILSE